MRVGTCGMLISRPNNKFVGIVTLMSEISVQAVHAKETLQEISQQARKLAEGLRNAAPSEKDMSQNPSILYLEAISGALLEMAEKCDALNRPMGPSSSVDDKSLRT